MGGDDELKGGGGWGGGGGGGDGGDGGGGGGGGGAQGGEGVYDELIQLGRGKLFEVLLEVGAARLRARADGPRLVPEELRHRVGWGERREGEYAEEEGLVVKEGEGEGRWRWRRRSTRTEEGQVEEEEEEEEAQGEGKRGRQRTRSTGRRAASQKGAAPCGRHPR